MNDTVLFQSSIHFRNTIATSKVQVRDSLFTSIVDVLRNSGSARIIFFGISKLVRLNEIDGIFLVI